MTKTWLFVLTVASTIIVSACSGPAKNFLSRHTFYDESGYSGPITFLDDSKVEIIGPTMKIIGTYTIGNVESGEAGEEKQSLVMEYWYHGKAETVFYTVYIKSGFVTEIIGPASPPLAIKYGTKVKLSPA